MNIINLLKCFPTFCFPLLTFLLFLFAEKAQRKSSVRHSKDMIRSQLKKDIDLHFNARQSLYPIYDVSTLPVNRTTVPNEQVPYEASKIAFKTNRSFYYRSHAFDSMHIIILINMELGLMNKEQG